MSLNVVLVPETHGLQYTPLVPLIRDKYTLSNESMNCGFEVSLPWDPFSLQRHEIIESKSTLHSELRLCLKHTVSDGMPDDDLKTIRIDDSAGYLHQLFDFCFIYEVKKCVVHFNSKVASSLQMLFLS